MVILESHDAFAKKTAAYKALSGIGVKIVGLRQQGHTLDALTQLYNGLTTLRMQIEDQKTF